MAKLFFSQLCLVLLLSSRVTHGAQGSGNHTWKPEDMTPEGVAETSTGSKKEVAIWPGKPNCGLPKCKFELYYFKGANFNSDDSGRKNILFITGGPGQIVNRTPKRHPLNFLENNHNVFYFDIRGAGLSKIEADNAYDKFLRADFVVKDIEEIRMKELKLNKAWDAIYAHSAGTIIAHKYAATYGAAKVTRLILTAPVSRQRDPEDTENAQIAMILSNLDAIYERYRSKNCIITKAMNLVDFFGIRKSNDDFCFLSDSRRTVIKNNLMTMFTAFNASYGSVRFVIQNSQDLLQEDNGFKEKYRYPEAFFRAIRDLENSGAPVEDLAFIEKTKDRQVDAALLIGYYLSFDKDDPALDPQSACR
ncbi:MAG: alpha/beta hydrolase, partial [Candidatus Binatia bacterium]|nr:alpha/beta hydrolase [Candidatus Binatia bacterium]